MRIGAVIPRYSLEALQRINLAHALHVWASVPFVLDDLPEAIDHAIVALLTRDLAGLKLSVMVEMRGPSIRSICLLTLGS